MEVPTSFGRDDAYRVESLLGRGGFATVHKAYQSALDRYVAIKVLRTEMLENAGALERFQREARVAARLSSHPNVVTIYDYGEQDGRAYLVLEYIDGTTLGRRLAQPLSAIEVEQIVNAVGSALDFAHANHLVHRDVKPSNVLLGNDGRILLSDFGIAKLLDTVTSATGGALGTIDYMPPEQIMGDPVDARSDIYAFGAMVYHMFAGRPPFEGSSTSILYRHVHEPPPALVISSGSMPSSVEPVVRRALAKRPDDRYASAGAFAADLARALRPATIFERARVALANNEFDQAEELASTLSLETANDPGGRYVSGRVARIRQVIQVAKLLENDNWRGALKEIDRLGLRESDEPEVVDLVRRADQLGRPESARAHAEQRHVERERPPSARIERVSSQPGGIATPSSNVVLPAVAPRTHADRPGRRALWLGLLVMGLVIAGVFVGMRLFTEGGTLSSGVASAPPSTTALPPLDPTSTLATSPATVAVSTATPAATSPAAAAASPVAASDPSHAAAHQAPPSAAPPSTVSATLATSEMLAPPLSTARHLHTATRLEDGKILVAGGRDGATALNSAELYDPASNTWTLTEKMTTPRYRHTATLLPDGQVLLVGGQRGDGGFLDTAERYEPSTNQWVPAGQMTAGRSGHTTTVLEDGRILVAGGYNTQQFHKSAELYDPATSAWTGVAAMADVHSGHTATRLAGGHVLIAGGFGSSSQATTERYDPSSNSWISSGSMNDGRLDHSAALLPDGRVLAAGGVNSQGGGTYLASTEAYDPATNRWTLLAPMAGPRSGHVVVMLPGGQVLVAGGRDASSSLSTSERYDVAAGTWVSVGTLAAARWLPASSLLPDGRVLLTGGRVGNSSLAFVEQYDPKINDWAGQGQTITLKLTSQNNSGITGAATMTNMGGGKLRVEMHAQGAGPGPYPAHIHEGSCAQLNPAPRFPLTNVVEGELVATIDASLQLVTSSPHAIHMHKSPDEMPIYVACADTRVPD